MNRIIAVLFFITFGLCVNAQPFVDPANFNTQVFHTSYKDSLHSKNSTVAYSLNLFFPKSFDNGNTFLIRLAGEKVESAIGKSYSDLYAISMPVGFQFLSKSKKWKTLVMAIPKISSDLRDNLSKDVQIGGTGLFTYVFNDSLKVKFGVFYNKECFGNFFVPLVGVDWKISKHFSMYGILPNNMRLEYKAGKKCYFGLGFRNFKRSYRLCSTFNNDFVLVKETQAKLFFDFYVLKNLVVFGDFSDMINYDFAQFGESDLKMENPLLNHPVYSPINQNYLFTVGLAYRIRTD